MSDSRRSSLGPSSPRAGAGLEKMAERADKVGSAAELAMGGTPMGPSVNLYKWGTNKAIKTFTPPSVLNTPATQQILRTRNRVLAGVGLAVTALGLWSHSKSHGGDHK